MEDKLQISFRGLKSTNSIKDYITKKISFLKKFDKYIDRINIEVSDNKSEIGNIKYEITIPVKKGLIRVEERGDDLYKLIEIAHDILKVKIEKYKDKATTHDYKSKEKLFEEDYIEKNSVENELPVIQDYSYKSRLTKRKVYSDNRPLYPEEAIEQMEMLGHTSFLFKDIETNKYGMVYKRKDGNYGLIEPEQV